MMRPGLRSLVVSVLVVGCGAARPPEPEAPAARPPAASTIAEPTSDEVLAQALDALLASPLCEPDLCLDPFPLASIRSWDGRGGRVAFAGPGALAGVYAGGRWDIGPLPGRARAHDVAFAPDGTLFAVGPTSLHRRDDTTWVEVASGEEEDGIWSAILPRSATEIWIATSSGRVLRAGADGVTPLEAQPRAMGSDRIWASGDSVAIDGPYGGASWDGRAWHVAVTEAELEAWGDASGCGAYGLAEMLFDEEDLYAEGDEDRVEPIIPRTPPLPAGPDRSPAGWIARVDPERRAGYGPWVEHPPSEIADVARDGDAWIAVGRSEGRGRMWARAGGELVTAELPDSIRTEHPSAAALAGEHAFVAAGGAIARFDLRAPGAATSASLPAGELATDVVARGPGALVLSSSGAVYAIDGATVVLLHRAPAPLRAIAADARRVVAVGDAGTIATSIDGVWSAVDASSSVDLRAVVLDAEGAWAAGGAGTIVRVEGTAARVLPRVTYEPLVDVQARGALVYGLSEAGAILAILPNDGTAWSRRARAIQRSGALALYRWEPDEGGAWAPIADRLDIALDEPGAVMPYAMLRGGLPAFRYRIGHGEDAAPVLPSVDSELEYELESTGMSCCDGAGDDYEATLDDADECIDDPGMQRCALGADPAYAIDARRRYALRIVEAGPRDARYCAPLRIDVVRVADQRVERSSPVFDCAGGQDARERAAWTWLAAPEQEAFETWPHLLEPGGSDEQLHLHRTASTDLLAFVSRDNRRATTWLSIRRPRGSAPVDVWAPVYHIRVSPDGDHTMVGAEIAGEPFVWVGPTPGSSGEREPAARGDVATCESLVVADSDGETNVRALPTSRAAIRGTIPTGTPFRARERHGSWIRLTSPIDGWVFRDNVVCSD